MPTFRETYTPRPPTTHRCDDCGDPATVELLVAGWQTKHLCFSCAERRRFGKASR